MIAAGIYCSFPILILLFMCLHRDTPLHIVNVYRVSRPAEVAAFQKKGETKLLFHSSKVSVFKFPTFSELPEHMYPALC